MELSVREHFTLVIDEFQEFLRVNPSIYSTMQRDWDLYKVGCFSFGGAYAAIPLIREVVLSYGWMDDEKLTYMIAVSESTPGPIMVNMATYVGASQAGFLGQVAMEDIRKEPIHSIFSCG